MSSHLVLYVKSAEERLTVTGLTSQNTVAELKARLETVAGVPADQQRLIFKGRVLGDAKALAEYGARTSSRLHLLHSTL